MPIFAVLYDYAPDSTELRAEHRTRHRAFLDELTGDVSVLATGTWTDGPDGALLIFEGTDQAAVETALDDDPFTQVGAITRRTVRGWHPVRGPWAGRD